VSPLLNFRWFRVILAPLLVGAAVSLAWGTYNIARHFKMEDQVGSLTPEGTPILC